MSGFGPLLLITTEQKCSTMIMAPKTQILLYWVKVHAPCPKLWVKHLKQYLVLTLMLFRMKTRVQPHKYLDQ